MAADADRLAAAGITPLAVVQAKPEVLKRFRVPVRTGSDPDRAVYTAFGLGRVPWTVWLRPDVLAGYIGHILRGRMLKLPSAGEDVEQQGGDFLLDRRLTVRGAWPSKVPTDRVAIETVIAAAREAAPGPARS